MRTVPLFLPPLRERDGDIPLLIDYFVTKFNRKYKKNVLGIDPKVMNMFKRYPWPGNVRELEHVLEYAFVFVKGPIITSSHLPVLTESKTKVSAPKPGLSAEAAWEDEKLAIQKALANAHGRREEAARLLGMSRSSLWRKMKTYQLD
ncbi:MAG: hypothetical protein HQK60_06540 [Deltaproteobacteria bacterium]|nr:hypothetical protein [Deltaproteobacteria bacterium]